MEVNTMLRKEQLLEILQEDVVPALGCTEPVCVALCAAAASNKLEQEILSIEVEVNSGIYKNGMSAGIPHFDKVGLDYAAAIGAFIRNSSKKLQIFEDITEEIVCDAALFVKENRVTVRLNKEEKVLYVKCTLKTKNNICTCVIKNSHTNIVLLEKNSKVLFENQETDSAREVVDKVSLLKKMKISEIRKIVDEMSEEELLFLQNGVDMNDALAAYSENVEAGVGIAQALRQNGKASLLSGGLVHNIMTKVSAAAESRLDGCSLPTMSSSGAGTKGIVVIIPVHETAKMIGADKEHELKALAFAHLVNRYINAYIGKLSPMCTCVMASSTAAAVGITYLLGGNDEQIGYAVRNMAGTVTGMICDGGKVGCALKVSTGSMAALMSAITAIQNAALRVTDGICEEQPEDNIKNMARIGMEGMSNMDRVIIEIMSNK